MYNPRRMPPFGIIQQCLEAGQVIPFLGAGVTFGTRPDGERWQPGAPFPPSGKELSQYLAGLSSLLYDDDRELDDLAKVASYFVDSSGVRDSLRQTLREVFALTCEPPHIHTYLARKALYYRDGEPAYAGPKEERETGGVPLLIVTTNYDDLIEKAFIQEKRPYDLVIYPTDCAEAANSVLWWKDGMSHLGPEIVAPNRLRIDLSRTNVIYKMHGSIHPERDLESYVITEDDYVDFLARMTRQEAIPAQFLRHFRSRHFLFLGYGLNDWNLRVVLRNLRSVLPETSAEAHPAAAGPAPQLGTAAATAATDEFRGDEPAGPGPGRPLGKIKSWAIQKEPSSLEVTLWESRDVDIFNQDIKAFGETMLTERWRQHGGRPGPPAPPQGAGEGAR